MKVNTSYVGIVGVCQDAGYPQCGCKESCCKNFESKYANQKFYPSSLVIVEEDTENRYWYIDLTISFGSQLKLFGNDEQKVDGVILTHAHIGHYFGMFYFGKPVMNSKDVSFYVMPKMNNFLRSNQPFKGIIEKNTTKVMENRKIVKLSDNISIEPILVNHRDEFSETIGVKVIGAKKKLLYIPDIDNWSEFDIVGEIKKVDYAILDGTFFKDGELKNRDMKGCPHPRINDSIEKTFSKLSEIEKRKISFIHFNHTNPVLDKESQEYKYVVSNGFHVSEKLQTFVI